MARVPERVTVVFDEAYYEFLDNPPDTLRYVREGRNVVVLRTFSKIQGLANLRIGYGIAPAEMVEILQKTRQPFNANGIAQAGALAGLADHEHQARTKAVTDEGRALLQEAFAEMGLEFIPSYANFVLVNVGDGRAMFEQLLAAGHHRARHEQLQTAGVDPGFGRHPRAEPALPRSDARDRGGALILTRAT